MYCSYLDLQWKKVAKRMRAVQVINLWHENQCAFLVGQIVFNGFILLPISSIMLIAHHNIFFPNETVTHITFHCSFCVLYSSSWVRAIPSFRFSLKKLHKVLTHKCFIQKMFKVIKHYLNLDFTKTIKRESWSVFRRRNCSSPSFSENAPLQFRVSQVLL